MNLIMLLLTSALPLIMFFGLIMFLMFIKNKKSEQIPDNNAKVWPYAAKSAGLSGYETALYSILNQSMPDSVVICPKMNLKEILYVNGQQGKAFYNYYKRLVYHTADFVLLSRADFKPICGVVLNNGSSKDSKHQNETESLKEVFKAAKLPLILVDAKGKYSLSDMETYFGKYIKFESVNTATENAVVNKAVKCPKCGAEMVKRTAKQGENQGNEFYGCSMYPACKGILNIS